MKIYLSSVLLLIMANGFSQEKYIDCKIDTSFSFTLESDCKNVLDYPSVSQGISNRFIPDERQILELTIIKNCGQTTTLDIASVSDSILVTRSDTGELATCECFQKCTLTVDNVFDSVAFNFFGTIEYLINPYHNSIIDNSAISLELYYHNGLIQFNREIIEPIQLKILNLSGQVLLDVLMNSKSMKIPANIRGFVICEISGETFELRKKIFID